MGDSGELSAGQRRCFVGQAVYGAVAVVSRGDSLLLIRRAQGVVAGGSWCLPGGGVEPGESSRQTVVREMAEEFRVRRELVVEGFAGISGVKCATPAGAFYAMPNITGTGLTSQEFEDKAMAEAGVALLAGDAFGEYGEGYARISFANSRENLQKAFDRLRVAFE